MSEWKNRHSMYGKVFTSTNQRPNGWSAVVTDDSQIQAPFRGTRYRVMAICRHWGIGYPGGEFMTLEDARSSGIEFADKMPQCLDIPGNGITCKTGWDVQRELLAERNAK